MYFVGVLMKVAHVLPLSLNLYGLNDRDIGEKSQFFLTNICKFESRLGVDVMAYMISSNSKFFVKSCEGYQVVFVPVDFEPKLVSHKFGHQVSLRLVFRVLFMRPDIVHFHGFLQHHLMYSMLTIMAKLFGVKVVAHHQGVTKKRFIEDLLTRIADRLVDVFIVANLDLEESLRQKVSQKNRVVFVPNGVDTSIFYPVDKLAAKSKLGYDSSELLVLWVGRLTRPQKDAFVAIKAVNQLRSQLGVRIKLVVIGHGEDEVALKKFASVSDKDGGGENVVFVEEYLGHDDLRVFYNAADLFVLNSSQEGMPQVALEAMACKTPVVLSDIAGNREIASDVGLLFPPNDSRGLAASLTLLIRDAVLRKSLGEKGYHKILSSYTWQKIAKTIVEDIYQ